MARSVFASVLLLFAFAFPGGEAGAGDWPQWRYGAARGAASPEALPESLDLRWSREYPQLDPAWDDPLNQDLMQYDTVYEPIVVGNTLIAGSNRSDCVTGLDTGTGVEKWTFFANGPVRLPPAAENGRVFVGSDDGFLYCLAADTGELLWKYNGVPESRLVIGNERVTSTWPVRGGPAVKDGKVYFAAGIWPFMGVFIYCLDAETGAEVWVNDGVSATWMNQPHNSPSFAGIAPQGSMVVEGGKLLVPGGRSVPACFDANTGEFMYYLLAESGKTGGAFTCAAGGYFVNYHRGNVVSLYGLNTGERLLHSFGGVPVMTEDRLYCSGEAVTAYDLGAAGPMEFEKQVRNEETLKIETVKEIRFGMKQLWSLDVDATGCLIQAGNRLYAGGDNLVSAIEIPADGGEPRIAWQKPAAGKVERLIAADGKLFAVTLDGKIYAFAEGSAEPVSHPWTVERPQTDENAANRAKAILETAGSPGGYGAVYGATDIDFLQALAEASELHWTAAAPEGAPVDAMRRELAARDLYGRRVAILGHEIVPNFPSYFAEIVVIESWNPADAGGDAVKAVYESVRPYGGAIWLNPEDGGCQAFAETAAGLGLHGARIETTEDGILIFREGALPGADDWTHQYGDIANTVKSDDKLVKLPLGLLWYGGSSNMDVLPRHGHGPPQQVVGGRLFIEGMDKINARDVYTGRVLWQRELPNLGNYGVYFDDTYKDTPLDTAYNQIHIPGANARGTNYVVTSDKVYVAHGDHCLVLDAATGGDAGRIDLPQSPLGGGDDEWGYIGVEGDYLIAGCGFVKYTDFLDLDPEMRDKSKPFHNFDITSSKRLAVMDRHTGEVVWTFQSQLGLRHNAIVAGNNTLFCIDRMPDPAAEALRRRGKKYTGTPRLLAFNLENGDIRWSVTADVFGTWLGYSAEHDILLQAGRPSRDMLVGEPRDTLSAYRGATGERMWINPDASYGGPSIIHGDKIITDRHAFSLLDGSQLMREHPLTGEKTPWEFQRNYGCNYAVASEYLMTFRSAAAGFFDLDSDGGTGNFGGFKSGCTSNLVAANGVLNAPDYTRTCSCAYQNQTSLALAHDPSVEIWTFNELEATEGPVRRLGLNFGAPGDRRADNGTMWFEYPVTGGPSPDLDVTIEPADAEWFLHHSIRMRGDGLNWVCASGVENARRIAVPLRGEDGERTYAVRLFFAEWEITDPGKRVFDVIVQGETRAAAFDIAKTAGGNRKSVSLEYGGVPGGEELVIELQPSEGSLPPVLCGLEIIQEPVEILRGGPAANDSIQAPAVESSR